MPDHIKQILMQLEGINSLKHEIQLRLGMLIHTQKCEQDRGKIEFLVALAKLNEELEACYHKVRHQELSPRKEERFIKRIRDLEDKRFQILNKINGNAVNDYNMLPVNLAV